MPSSLVFTRATGRLFSPTYGELTPITDNHVSDLIRFARGSELCTVVNSTDDGLVIELLSNSGQILAEVSVYLTTDGTLLILSLDPSEFPELQFSIYGELEYSTLVDYCIDNCANF